MVPAAVSIQWTAWLRLPCGQNGHKRCSGNSRVTQCSPEAVAGDQEGK
jgi:hypothetical protein